MTARRTTMSTGAAVQSRLGSGTWNSKRRSQAHTREQTIRPTCNTSTSRDRQRNSAGDFLLLLIFLIARQDDWFGCGHLYGSSSWAGSSLNGKAQLDCRDKAAGRFHWRGGGPHITFRTPPPSTSLFSPSPLTPPPPTSPHKL